MDTSKQRHKITRNREFRACVACRERKLRCDRQKPCGTCTRRDDGSPCVYERNSSGAQGRRAQAEVRLGHLEQLVHDLQSQQNSSDTYSQPSDGTDMSVGSRNGHPTPQYHGVTHCSAMLDDIDGLRDALLEDGLTEETPWADDIGDEGIGLLFGASPSLPFSQILISYLPTRNEVDRMVSAYLNRSSVKAPFIHTVQFNRLYQSFWSDHHSVPILWVSILFSILDIASRAIQPQQQLDDNSHFATAAAHCLATASYHQMHPFAIEALLLYSQARCMVSTDIPPAVATLMSTVVRMAVSMGYHRDARHLSKPISAFEGEMRRRTWSLCLQLDVLVSFQLGLPSNVQFPTWDTAEPSNLFDSDFDEASQQLPPSRVVDNEVTGLSFYIAKYRLAVVFEKVLRYALSIGTTNVDELTKIDHELRNTYDELPPMFHDRSLADSVVDLPSVIVARLCVYFIYLKSMCVLHRTGVTQKRLESIRVCHESATAIISRVIDIVPAFAPGGQLDGEKWFMGSLTWHDFLVGCTVLCLTICVTHETNEISAESLSDLAGTMALLAKAEQIIAARSNHGSSRDTLRVKGLLRAMQARFSVTTRGNTSSLDGSTEPESEATSGEQWTLLDDQDWMGPAMRVDEPDWALMEQFLNIRHDDGRMPL